MRILLLIFIVVFSNSGLQAQTSSYKTDLAELRSLLQATPSFKAQLKGDKLKAFNEMFLRLAADSISDSNGFPYFYNLSQLIFPLKDNHLAFYQVADYSNFKTRETIDHYITTKEFSDYPHLDLNTDSLRSVLEKKPADSLEGIYHYDKFYSVGIFKSSSREYVGVVLNSDVSLWRKGQIAIHLYEYQPNLYKAIYGHPLTKNFILQTSEKYKNQSLINSYFYGSYSEAGYSKNLQQTRYSNLPKSASRFDFKNISNDIQYLLVRSFQVNTATSGRSAEFYDSIKNLLKASNLVLDLRNNEGGAEKATRSWYKLLKKYSQKGRLYILVNNETISQAEIFTLELKKLKNVTVVGQTTKGMLSYGSNYGKRVKLPSGKFELYPTDMKGNTRLLDYEDRGIDPDVFLDSNSDWITQLTAIITKNDK